jgi:hypothetical protein
MPIRSVSDAMRENYEAAPKETPPFVRVESEADRPSWAWPAELEKLWPPSKGSELIEDLLGCEQELFSLSITRLADASDDVRQVLVDIGGFRGDSIWCRGLDLGAVVRYWLPLTVAAKRLMQQTEAEEQLYEYDVDPQRVRVRAQLKAAGFDVQDLDAQREQEARARKKKGIGVS